MPSESLTVAEVLRQQSVVRAEHPLLVCDAERLSYAEADRRSARLARGLIALGAGKGTHIGLLHPNGGAFVAVPARFGSGKYCMAATATGSKPMARTVSCRAFQEMRP